MTSIPSEVQRFIDILNLKRHPEGGWYGETFRSPSRVTADDGRDRAAMTSIYYLLGPGDQSAWHRVRSDEIWYWHAGGVLALYDRDANGVVTESHIGPDGPFHAVRLARFWQAARPVDPEGWVLVGCAVAPGFTFEDFELDAMP